MKKMIATLLCLVLCVSALPATQASSRNVTMESALAQSLYELGLFQGVSEGEFDLLRAPSRAEAIVMLVRLLGAESAAMEGGRSHPFNDVPEWAEPYISYAYELGLTSGVSETEFGTGRAESAMYLTFVLRALGYEEGVDFSWRNPFLVARAAGILPPAVQADSFLRADVVTISYAALSAEYKASGETLAQRLISAGAITQAQLDASYDISLLDLVGVSLGEQLYYDCAPAVFLITVFGSNGARLGTGSGFFIDEAGTAVTNFHVIDGAYSARATLFDGTTREVVGVYDYSAANDWAVIKMEEGSYSYLELGEGVSEGQTIYTLGSPLGLSTSITQGVVSRAERVEGGTAYIQISAPISSGSSGGALLNERGEVVGITTGAYVYGQNMNLAVPISYIADYSSERAVSLASLRGEIAGTEIREMETIRGIPDFGAYMNVEAFWSGSYLNYASYYYSHEDLKGAGTYDSAMTRYTELLREWGFYASAYYVSSDGQFSLRYSGAHNQYSYTITIIPDDYFHDEDTGNTIACVSITIMVNGIYTPTTYEQFPNIPDFGDVFETSSFAEGNLTGSSYFYEYYDDDIVSVGYQGFYAEIYGAWLEAWGFALADAYTTAFMNYYRFYNRQSGYTIELTDYTVGQRSYISVVIHSP